MKKTGFTFSAQSSALYDKDVQQIALIYSHSIRYIHDNRITEWLNIRIILPDWALSLYVHWLNGLLLLWSYKNSNGKEIFWLLQLYNLFEWENAIILISKYTEALATTMIWCKIILSAVPWNDIVIACTSHKRNNK